MSQYTTANVVSNQVYNKTYIIDIYSNYSLNNVPLQLTNVDVISDMLANVIQTSPGERPFLPQFGSGVPALLFNIISQGNANLILQDIFFSAKNFIPYITVNTQTSQVYADMINGVYFIILNYTIDGLPGVISTNISLAANQ
jgi:phage baseplate assembly protein W